MLQLFEALFFFVLAQRSQHDPAPALSAPLASGPALRQLFMLVGPCTHRFRSRLGLCAQEGRSCWPADPRARLSPGPAAGSKELGRQESAQPAPCLTVGRLSETRLQRSLLLPHAQTRTATSRSRIRSSVKDALSSRVHPLRHPWLRVARLFRSRSICLRSDEAHDAGQICPYGGLRRWLVRPRQLSRPTPGKLDDS